MSVNKPCCIDIYRGDEISDAPSALAGLDRVKATGIFACIHKASEGTAYTDARYDARRAKWMSGGPVAVTDVDGAKLSLAPVWGAYHFFHGDNPAAEATHFLRTARLTAADLPVLDWEPVGASGHQPSVAEADAFCKAVEDALGRPCAVYGGNAPRERFASERVPDAILEAFSRRPLWLCAYGAYSPEKLHSLIPTPWKEVGIWLWQDDGDKFGPGPHSMPGISGYCDNSTVVSPMTFARLHSEWLGEPKAVAAAPTQPVLTPLQVEELDETENGPGPKEETFLEHVEGEIKHIAQEIGDELKGDNA